MHEIQPEQNSHNDSPLLEELTTAYKDLSTKRFVTGGLGLTDALQCSDIRVSALAYIEIDKFGRKLNEIIVKDGRFPGDSVRMVQGDGGACGFYPQFVGVPLIRRTLQTGNPVEAIEWLQKVLGITVASGKVIHALWGVSVEEEIQLTPNVKIVPIELLPDSEQKQWITGHSYFRSGSPVASMLNFTPAKSALVADRRIEPFTFNPDSQSQNSNDEFEKMHELLSDITLVLSVVGPRVVLSSTQWFTFDDPDLEQATMLSGQRRQPMLEILPSHNLDYPMLDSVEAQEIVRAYLVLNGNARSKVRVALERLSQALRRRNVGDRSVELSTAFEALLGDNATNEMTHKIKVRSVRLIGGNEVVRKRNAAIINKAYSIRSKLVHTGHVSSNEIESICGERMGVEAIIGEALLMCVDLIKIIIRRGSIPDWSVFDITERAP